MTKIIFGWKKAGSRGCHPVSNIIPQTGTLFQNLEAAAAQVS
ncbi:hypothetical protein QUB61_34505 [Microcoleus sp. C2D2]